MSLNYSTPTPGTTPVVGADSRTFARPLVVHLLSSVFFTAFVGVVVFFLAQSFISPGRKSGVPIRIAVVVIVVLLTLYYSAWRQYMRVRVSSDRVTVLRATRVLHDWDRRTTSFGSRITVHRTNGVVTNTTRALVATVEGKEISVPTGLSRDKFNELTALLIPVVAQTPEPGYQDRSFAAPLTEGTLDLSEQRRKFQRGGTVAKVLGVVMTLVGVGMLATVGAGVIDFSRDEIVILFAVGLVLAALGVGAFIATLLNRAALRSRPASLAVSMLTLTVGDVNYPLNSLEKLTFTPPSYPNPTMEVRTQMGKKTKVFLRSGEETAQFIQACVNAAAASARPDLVAIDRG